MLKHFKNSIWGILVLLYACLMKRLSIKSNPFRFSPVPSNSFLKDLTITLLLLSVGIFGGCSKDQLPRVSNNQTISQSAIDRDGSDPCNMFPGMVGIAYQTVRYNDNQQIADMYTMIGEQDIAPLAEQLITMHETQGQAATLAYMQTLGYSAAEVGLLNSFFNQASTLDYNNLTNASINGS